MPARKEHLYVLRDLALPKRTGRLAKEDLQALKTIADWTRDFVAQPHPHVGRRGPVPTIFSNLKVDLSRQVFSLTGEPMITAPAESPNVATPTPSIGCSPEPARRAQAGVPHGHP
jgi:hypothetical protein